MVCERAVVPVATAGLVTQLFRGALCHHELEQLPCFLIGVGAVVAAQVCTEQRGQHQVDQQGNAFLS